MSRTSATGSSNRVVGFAGGVRQPPVYQSSMTERERERFGKQNTKDVDRFLKEQSKSEQAAAKERADAQKQIATFQKEADRQQAAEDKRSQAQTEAARRAQLKAIDEVAKGVDRLKAKQGSAAEQAAQKVKDALDRQKKAYADYWQYIDRAKEKGIAPNAQAVAAKKGAIDRAESHTGVAKRELDEASKARERGAQAARQQELATARAREGYSRLTASITSSVDAVTRLGEGMAYLGLVGERDLHSLTDSLLQIRGTVDSIRGGVGTLTDAFSLARNLRDVRATGGGMAGYGRALIGMEPVVSAARTTAQAFGGGVAANTIKIAGGAAVGTEAAGALTSAGPSIAAAIASPLGIAVAAAAATALAGYGVYRGTKAYGAASERYGKGEREYAGQSKAAFVSNQTAGGYLLGNESQRIAEGGGGFIARPLAKLFLNRGPLAERTVTGRVVKDDFNYKSQEQLDTEHQSRVDRAAKEKERRDQMDRGWAGGFSDEFGRAHDIQELRSRQRESRRRLTATGDPMTDQRAALADLQAEMRETAEIQRRAMSERQKMRVGEQGGVPRGGEFDVRSTQEVVRADERIRSLKQEQAELVRDMQRTAIDGLKRQADLQRGIFEEAKAGAEEAKKARMSFEQRIATMNPMQVAKLASLKKRQQAGEQLSTEQERFIEQYGDEAMRQRLERSQTERGQERIKSIEKSTGVELGNRERMRQEATEWEVDEERDRQIDAELNVGRAEKQFKMEPVKVDGKIQTDVDVKLRLDGLSGLSSEIERGMTQAMPDIIHAFDGQFGSLEERILARVKNEIANSIARQNQQGRNAAGGGGF